MNLNSAGSPKVSVIIETAAQLFKEGGDDAVMDYLSIVASYDHSCPDRCSIWAMDFFDIHEQEIKGEES